MKIEKKQAEFQPVVITLETQDEVDQMFALAKYSCFEDEEVDITYLLFSSLEGLQKQLWAPENGSTNILKKS